jgi:hypothetical protein
VAQHTPPFYSEFAWAFDLLIDRPVRKECATIANSSFQRLAHEVRPSYAGAVRRARRLPPNMSAPQAGGSTCCMK